MSFFRGSFILVLVFLSAFGAVSFDCGKVTNPSECRNIGSCTWNSTCYYSITDSYTDKACSGVCITDPCLSIRPYPSTGTWTCASPTGSAWSCTEGFGYNEHFCEIDTSTSPTTYTNRTNPNAYCHIDDNNYVSLSKCFLNYYKTGSCTDVDGDYCKLYDIMGGQTCERIRGAERISTLSDCSCLSVENCKYFPHCYISGSRCQTDSCSSYNYNFLTGKCQRDSTCDSNYDNTNCVPLGLTQATVKYDYTNKTANPGTGGYSGPYKQDEWTYNSRQTFHYTSYICIEESLHTTLPNTCYYLSSYILKNPSLMGQSGADPTELWYNYNNNCETRDSCNFCTKVKDDVTSCTSKAGCSVVDIGGDKICSSDVSAGASFIHSPSIVLILLLIGAFLFSN